MTIVSFAHKTNSKALWNVEILADSRDYEWTQKLYVMDSTTISLFSNVLKGAGRNPKIGRKNGGIKSHTIMKALTGVPEFIRHTAARVHDHVMLSMVKLPKDSFIAFDRAYIDYRVFEKFTSRGWSNTWIRIPASAGSCLRTTWN